MKHNYLKLFMLCLFSFVGMSIYAYDCEVDGIYYNLNTKDNTASVTYEELYSGVYCGTVNIPESIVYNGVTYAVTSIDDYAFSWCYDLTKVTIGNNVTFIGNGAFGNCRDLTEVTIPASVISLGDVVFAYCSALTEAVIPNSVISIGEGVFSGCSSLIKIAVDELNPNYDSREDCNAIIRTNDDELIAGCKNTSIPNGITFIGNNAFHDCWGLMELTIPNSVTFIGYRAFAGCSMAELTIPNSVTFIDDYAFSDCSNLRELTIPNSVTSISEGTFAGCKVLTKLTIPNSVTNIGNHAFYYTSLLSVTSLNPVPPITESCFDSATYQNATLHVPIGGKEAYEQVEGWKDFQKIQDDVDTGIESIITDKQSKAAIYTLDGKRLPTTNAANLSKGIYIVNGKKYVVK